MYRITVQDLKNRVTNHEKETTDLKFFYLYEPWQRGKIALNKYQCKKIIYGDTKPFLAINFFLKLGNCVKMTQNKYQCKK